MNCRHCGNKLTIPFADLGTAPPSNSYLTSEQLSAPEKWYPLKLMTCSECWLVQTLDFVDREECFSSDYAYFSSTSTSWVEHARQYVEKVTARFRLGPQSLVVEIAANDGYLLQHVVAKGIPCYGVEPTASTAEAARQKDIPIEQEFFGLSTALQLRDAHGPASLIVANNVLAHVPDINDFVAGFATLIADDGVVTFEFPHVLELIRNAYFDTIYHEHFSYLSLGTVKRILEAQGLSVFDVEKLPTHGKSLRVYAQKSIHGQHAETGNAPDVLAEEEAFGLFSAAKYLGFQSRAEAIKNNFLEFLIQQKRASKIVIAYGAAAKGNTLLNFAGVKDDLISSVVDRSPAKVGQYLPGSRIPIREEAWVSKARPNVVVVLPWNIQDEVRNQLAYVRNWGAILAVAVPEIKELP